MKRADAVKRSSGVEAAGVVTVAAERGLLGWAAVIYAALAAIVFADVLAGAGDVVLSKVGHDTANQFLHWRQLAFEQLRQGHLTLWNPHTSAGCPFFGSFQAAILYPVNWVHLILPTCRAVNVEVTVNVFLAGFFMHLWMHSRRLSFPACLAAGTMFMFGGPLFHHLYAGHLVNLAVMAWGPLLFLALDGILERGGRRFVWAGGAAVAMMILGGHPQYVFYTAIAAFLYVALRLWSCPRRLAAVGDLALLNAGALAVTAIQWMTGLGNSGETVRSTGLSYEFASMFSFPPENLLTLLSPSFFGDGVGLPYWGRCYLWEMDLYIGAAGLGLLGTAFLVGHRRRERNVALAMAAAMFFFALGARMPWFRFLYDFVPGFDRFRANCKFIYLVVLFLVPVAAIGLDAIWRRAGTSRVLPALPAGVLAGLALAAGFLIRADGGVESGWWRDVVHGILNTGEIFGLPPAIYQNEAFIHETAVYASQRMLLAGVLMGAVAFLLGVGRMMRRPVWAKVAAWALLGVLAMDLAWTARRFRPTFHQDEAVLPSLGRFLAQQKPGDYRILNPTLPDAAIPLRAYDLWGADPSMVRRYVEFFFFLQGENPNQASQYLPLKYLPVRLGMLRGKFAFIPKSGRESEVVEIPDPLPRFLLVRDWRVEEKRDDVFAAIGRPDFNPRATVFLERSPSPSWVAAAGPSPSPVPNPKSPIQTPKSPTDSIRLLRENTDWQEVEVTLPSPAVLVETDLYTPNWHAYALPGSAESSYELIPADYILRGIPLKAGTHRLRIEYRPRAFVVGKWISLASLALFAGLGIAGLVRGRRRCTPDSPELPAVPSNQRG